MKTSLPNPSTAETGVSETPCDHARSASPSPRATFSPRFDVWEGDDEIVLYGDLPGIEPEQLAIQFENRQLTIDGKLAELETGERSVYCEYQVGDFHRAFTIDESIDGEAITAEFRDGVLKLRLPKSEAAKPRRIVVNAN